MSHRLLCIFMYNIGMKNNQDSPIIVSACLAGLVTNYLGGSFPNDRVIELVREGKEDGQAVAYMEDGTMIVVTNAGNFIGQTREIVITSILYTQAGKMIFAKLQ